MSADRVGTSRGAAARRAGHAPKTPALVTDAPLRAIRSGGRRTAGRGVDVPAAKPVMTAIAAANNPRATATNRSLMPRRYVVTAPRADRKYPRRPSPKCAGRRKAPSSLPQRCCSARRAGARRRRLKPRGGGTLGGWVDRADCASHSGADMALVDETPRVTDPDAGVIEDARSRQRRHRMVGLAAIAAAAALAVGGVALWGGGGGGAGHARGSGTGGHGRGSRGVARGERAARRSPVAAPCGPETPAELRGRGSGLGHRSCGRWQQRLGSTDHWHADLCGRRARRRADAARRPPGGCDPPVGRADRPERGRCRAAVRLARRRVPTDVDIAEGAGALVALNAAGRVIPAGSAGVADSPTLRWQTPGAAPWFSAAIEQRVRQRVDRPGAVLTARRVLDRGRPRPAAAGRRGRDHGRRESGHPRPRVPRVCGRGVRGRRGADDRERRPRRPRPRREAGAAARDDAGARPPRGRRGQADRTVRRRPALFGRVRRRPRRSPRRRRVAGRSEHGLADAAHRGAAASCASARSKLAPSPSRRADRPASNTRSSQRPLAGLREATQIAPEPPRCLDALHRGDVLHRRLVVAGTRLARQQRRQRRRASRTSLGCQGGSLRWQVGQRSCQQASAVWRSRWAW